MAYTNMRMRVLAAFAVTTALASPAFAQTAPTQVDPNVTGPDAPQVLPSNGTEPNGTEGDIVVTGIRRSLEAARDLKRKLYPVRRCDRRRRHRQAPRHERR